MAAFNQAPLNQTTLTFQDAPFNLGSSTANSTTSTNVTSVSSDGSGLIDLFSYQSVVPSWRRKGVAVSALY